MTTSGSLLTEDALKFLGQTVQDKVTGVRGVVTSVCFDLYGCVQAVVTPKYTGRRPDSQWMDVARLKVLKGGARVMPMPAFASTDKGPADKPEFERLPRA